MVLTCSPVISKDWSWQPRFPRQAERFLPVDKIEVLLRGLF